MSKKWEKIRNTHGNSIEAYYDGKLHGVFNRKEQDIIGCLRAIGKGTDRDISDFLDSHKSEYQPRISDLIDQAKILEECGSKIDDITGKRVRVVRIIPQEDKNQLNFGW